VCSQAGPVLAPSSLYPYLPFFSEDGGSRFLRNIGACVYQTVRGVISQKTMRTSLHNAEIVPQATQVDIEMKLTGD
jgi:hypothetical protein